MFVSYHLIVPFLFLSHNVSPRPLSFSRPVHYFLVLFSPSFLQNKWCWSPVPCTTVCPFHYHFVCLKGCGVKEMALYKSLLYYIFCKGHFQWKILKSMGNFGRGTKAKTRGNGGHDLHGHCIIPGLKMFFPTISLSLPLSTEYVFHC